MPLIYLFNPYSFCVKLNASLTYTCTGNKGNNKNNGYTTWDPRRLNGGANGGDGGAHGVQYDEIPYGDVGPGQSGKGQLPEVPVEYSQVPQIPQRQGEIWSILLQLNSFN